MDFSFNEDQQLISETASTFLASVSDSAAVRAAMETPLGYDSNLWQRITGEMGWQLTHIPEQQNGLGLGYVEFCILHEQAGKHLLCAPFLSSTALAVSALLCASTQAAKSLLAENSLNNELLTLAYASNQRMLPSQDVVDSLGCSYVKNANGYQLNGTCHYVIDGHSAEKILVAARSDRNVALFVISADAIGLSRNRTPTMDQTRKLARLDLRDLEVEHDQCLVVDDGQVLSDTLALACIALAAEQTGVAERCLDLAVTYMGERKQFGRVIGGFQALKHKAADMLNKIEAARSATYYAACIADEFLSGGSLAGELHEAASIAKSYSCDAAFYCAGSSLQLHGGVGFTWEYDVHLYFKRAKASQLAFGDSAWHRERIATLLLDNAGGAS